MPKAASGPNSISSLTCELPGDPGSNRLASSFMPALSRSSALSNCGVADISADISQVSPSQVSPRQGAKPMADASSRLDASECCLSRCRIAVGRDLGDGIGQTVFLQHLRLPPEEHGGDRHGDEDLKQDPQVHAREYTIERADMGVRTAQTYDLVGNRRGQKKNRHVAGELGPALVRVVEGLAKDEAEKIM